MPRTLGRSLPGLNLLLLAKYILGEPKAGAKPPFQQQGFAAPAAASPGRNIHVISLSQKLA